MGRMGELGQVGEDSNSKARSPAVTLQAVAPELSEQRNDGLRAELPGFKLSA